MQTKELKTIANRIGLIFKGSKTGNNFHVSNNGRLRLRAENWDGFIEHQTDPIGENVFSYSVSKTELDQLIEASSRLEIIPNSDDQIESGNLRVKVSRGEKYCSWDESSIVSEFEFEGHDLKRMIEGSVFATDEFNARYALSGVAITFDHLGKPVFWASDGKRLVIKFQQPMLVGKSIPKPNWAEVPIVSALHLRAILKTLPKRGRATMTVRRNHIQFVCDNYRSQFRLVEGRFPNCSAIVAPAMQDREFLFSSNPVSQLSSAIESETVSEIVETDKRGKPIFGDDFYDLRVDSKSDKVTIGKRVYVIGARTAESDFQVRLGSKMTLEFLWSLPKNETVDVYQTGNQITPMIFETADSIFIQMPMNVK